MFVFFYHPVYYKFDTNMTKELLDKITIECEKSGVNVRGVVFDMGNQTFIKEVQLRTKLRNEYEHPSDPGKRIYLFPDVPHMES